MTKVLTFSLFGSNERYLQGIVANAQLYQHVYPEWKMRVYYNSSVPIEILQRIQKHDVELVRVHSDVQNPTLWRFRVALDEEVDIFCCRDADSRLSLRESTAVSEWLQKQADIHIMTDHPGHLGRYSILAGMWCAKSSSVRAYIHELLKDQRTANFDERPGYDYFFTDQELLLDYIGSKLYTELTVLHHRSFGCAEFPDGKQFPLPRTGLEHVGAVYIGGFLRQRDANMLLDAIVKKEQCD